VARNDDPTRAQRLRALDPNVEPWEQQPGESDQAYAGFLIYRDQEKRSTREVGPSAGHWSSEWMWSLRVLEWDRSLQRTNDEQLIRYRMAMAERQRAAGRLAQQKIANWLIELDPARLSPHEAARWFEVAVRVEREAAGATSGQPDLIPPAEGPWDPFEGMTLGEVLGGDVDEISAAEEIWAQLQAREDDDQG
jgi:hypothetical protein